MNYKECGLSQAGLCGAEDYLGKDFNGCPFKAEDGTCTAKPKNLRAVDIDI